MKEEWKRYKRSLLGFFVMDFAFCFQLLLFVYFQNVGVIPSGVCYLLLSVIIFPSIIALTGIIIIFSYDIFNQKEIHRLKLDLKKINKVIEFKKTPMVSYEHR